MEARALVHTHVISNSNETVWCIEKELHFGYLFSIVVVVVGYCTYTLSENVLCEYESCTIFACC